MFSCVKFDKIFVAPHVVKNINGYIRKIEENFRFVNQNGFNCYTLQNYIGNIGGCLFPPLSYDDGLEIEKVLYLDPLEQSFYLFHNNIIGIAYCVNNLPNQSRKLRILKDEPLIFNILKKYMDKVKYQNYFNYSLDSIGETALKCGAMCGLPREKGSTLGAIFPSSCVCDKYILKNDNSQADNFNKSLKKTFGHKCRMCEETITCKEINLWGGSVRNNEGSNYNDYAFNENINEKYGTNIICDKCLEDKSVRDIENRFDCCRDNRLNHSCSVNECNRFMGSYHRALKVMYENIEGYYTTEDYNFEFFPLEELNLVFMLEFLIENFDNEGYLINSWDFIISKYSNANNISFIEKVQQLVIKRSTEFKKLFEKNSKESQTFFIDCCDSLHDSFNIPCEECVQSDYVVCLFDDMDDFHDFSYCDFCDDRFLEGHRHMSSWGGEKQVCECCIDNSSRADMENWGGCSQYGDDIMCLECGEFISSIETYGEYKDLDDDYFQDFACDYEGNMNDDEYTSRTRFFKCYCVDCINADEELVDKYPTKKELIENILIMLCKFCNINNVGKGCFCGNCNDNLFFKYRGGQLTNNFLKMIGYRLKPLIEYKSVIECIGIDTCYISMEDEEDCFIVKKNCNHGLNYKYLLDMSKFKIGKDRQIDFKCGMCRQKVNIMLDYI